jgi:hypothetical protein
MATKSCPPELGQEEGNEAVNLELGELRNDDMNSEEVNIAIIGEAGSGRLSFIRNMLE